MRLWALAATRPSSAWLALRFCPARRRGPEAVMPLLCTASACWLPDCCTSQHTVIMVHVSAEAMVGRQINTATAAAAVPLGQLSSTAVGLAVC